MILRTGFYSLCVTPAICCFLGKRRFELLFRLCKTCVLISRLRRSVLRNSHMSLRRCPNSRNSSLYGSGWSCMWDIMFMLIFCCRKMCVCSILYVEMYLWHVLGLSILFCARDFRCELFWQIQSCWVIYERRCYWRGYITLHQRQAKHIGYIESRYSKRIFFKCMIM